MWWRSSGTKFYSTTEQITSTTPNVTEGKFVGIFKKIDDYQLFNQFYDSPQIWLKTKGLRGQFLKMHVSKFQSLAAQQQEWLCSANN